VVLTDRVQKWFGLRQEWEDYSEIAWETEILSSHVSILETKCLYHDALCCIKLFNVSAASISSIDMPERTEVALCDRSWSGLVMSTSNEPGLRESVEERCAERGGEKAGGTA
jgi:hypothetical protein